MKSAIRLLIGFCLLVGIVGYAADDSPSGRDGYDKYKVIYERNVFSKDRLPPRSPGEGGDRVRTTKVLSIYILRGIAAEKGRSHQYAFVEEEVSGESQMAKVGTEILGGTIKEIQLNYVLFEENGQVRKIRVGEQFGSTSTTVTTEVSTETEQDKSAEEGASQEKAEEPPSWGDESDILKKLMERRKRELGT